MKNCCVQMFKRTSDKNSEKLCVFDLYFFYYFFYNWKCHVQLKKKKLKVSAVWFHKVAETAILSKGFSFCLYIPQ